ncbi:hypothetical protein CR513_52510, partial [Mucuna pruriens]
MVSLHMLDDGGYDNHFGYGKWKHTKSNLVVVKGEKISKLYGTKALVAKDSVNSMDMEASLWHRRLSHISENGLKNADLGKCSHCMVDKQSKVKSFSGALYFVTFINDCSRKLWVYTLKSKDQVERQSGKKVKCFHSDNGGEYCGPFDYDHLQVFDCKAFVHVPKDERSNLDMKTRQCIFIGYGHDEYGYRMYDPVEKKLIKNVMCNSRKVKKSIPMKDNSLSEIDLVRMPVHDLDTVDNNLGDNFDVPPDDDVEEEQEKSQDENLRDAPEPPSVQLRRSNRQRQSSTRYTSDEYVEENLNITKSPWRVKRGKMLDNLNCRSVLLCPLPRSKHIDVRYHWIRNALDAKLLELAKVHTGDNGVDMLTKVVQRGKFEACCEIARLVITVT